MVQSIPEPEESARSARSPVAHPGDVELARRVLGDDDQAMREFVERMRCVPRMLTAKSMELRANLDQGQLDDLTQDTLCAIWRRLPEFAGRSTLETWVYRFCHLELFRVLREQRRLPAFLDEANDILEPTAPSESRNSTDYERMLRYLSELDADEADIVRLKHFDERTFEQIAASLLLSPNTVKSRYYRGILKLRRRLAPSPATGHAGGDA